MALPAAAGLRAAYEAGSSKTASLARFLHYLAALYPHLADAHAFACRPNGILRLRYRRYQDTERAWHVFVRSITGGTRRMVIGFGNAHIGNQLGGRPHGAKLASCSSSAGIDCEEHFQQQLSLDALWCSHLHGPVCMLQHLLPN